MVLAMGGLGALPEASGAPPRKPTRSEAPPITVWAGLVAGPLAPKAAGALESRLLALMEDQRAAPVVDPGGRPLNRAAEARAEAEHARNFEAGIQALLSEDYERALREFERAGELFERALAGTADHRRRHETLVAKATAYADSARKEAARATLRELAALDPGETAPHRGNQAPALVALYEEARDSLGARARLRLRPPRDGLRVRLNGREIEGPADLALAPGRHLMWVEGDGIRQVQVITLSAGEDRVIEIPLEGPEARQRRSFLEDLAFRPAQSRASAAKLLRLSGAALLITGWVRREAGGADLHLARLGPGGEVESVGRAPLEGDGRAVEALTAAILDRRRSGGFEVTESGQLVPQPKLDGALGLGARR